MLRPKRTARLRDTHCARPLALQPVGPHSPPFAGRRSLGPQKAHFRCHGTSQGQPDHNWSTAAGANECAKMSCRCSGGRRPEESGRVRDPASCDQRLTWLHHTPGTALERCSDRLLLVSSASSAIRLTPGVERRAHQRQSWRSTSHARPLQCLVRLHITHARVLSPLTVGCHGSTSPLSCADGAGDEILAAPTHLSVRGPIAAEVREQLVAKSLQRDPGQARCCADGRSVACREQLPDVLR